MTNQELAPLIRAKLLEFQELVNELECVDVRIDSYKHANIKSDVTYLFEVKLTETKIL